MTEYRILALGDSYTIGELMPEDERWPVQLAGRLRALGLPVAQPWIIARTGWQTAQLDAAISAANPSGPFDLVTLLIGVNDQYHHRPLEEYRAQFHALLARAIGFAAGQAARVLVLSIPDWGITPFALASGRMGVSAEIEAFNLANRAEVQAAGARYIDITPLSRLAAQDRALLAADDLHPSAAMYAAWVELLLPQALEILKPRSCQSQDV